MISAGNPAHFVPFGRQFINFSGEFSSTERGKNGKNFIEETFVDESVLNTENVPLENFKFRKIESENFQEIYFREKVVILSKNGKTLIKSFFLDFPVFEALWCNFPSDQNLTHSKQLSAVCFFGKQNFEVHTNEGEQISLTLPFEVSKCFETRQGLLLQRLTPPSDKQSVSSYDDSPFPFFFSISHPLNEVLPVLYKPTDKTGRSLPAKYTTNSSLTSLHVDVKHSILFTYDSKISSHRLWTIKKATNEDALSAARYLEQSMTCGKTPSIVRSNTSLLQLLRDSTPSASCSSAGGAQEYSEQKRPSSSMNTLSNGASSSTQSSGFLPNTLSPIYGLSPFLTPNSSNNVTNERTPRTLVNGNKFNSPAVSRLLGLIRQKTPSMFSSPLPTVAMPSYRTTPRNTKNRFLTPVLNGSTAPDIAAMECSQYWPAEPLIPDVCFDHLWTENATSTKSDSAIENKPATKSFLVEDFVGQKYFCFLRKEFQELRCLKLKSEDDIVTFVHPNWDTIPCKDVALAMDSRITIVLDLNFTPILYSGVIKISILHVNTTSLLSFGCNILTANEEGSQGNSRIFSSSRAASMSSSSPLKRSFVEADVSLSPVVSEIYPNSDTPQGNELTPVGSQSIGSFIAGVETVDASSNIFLMRLMSQKTCKISLPPLCRSPAVKLCLDSLCLVLPKDKSMNLCLQWYLLNNSPFAKNDNNESNFLLFTKFLAGLIGFQTAKMKLFQTLSDAQTTSSIVLAKKPKCVEEGSDSDWEYVLNRQISNCLEGFSLSDGLKSASVLRNGDDNDVHRVANDGSLFKILPSVFWVLHNCYEDMKLQKHCFNDLKILCKVLHSMSSVLKLSSYVDLYERDCSELIGLVPEAYIDESDFKKLQYPYYWKPDAWMIFNQLHRMFEDGEVGRQPIYILLSCVRVWLVHVLYGLFFSKIKCARDLDAYVKRVGPLNEYQMKITQILDRPELDNVGKLKEIFRFDVDLTSMPCGVLLPLFETAEILSFDKTARVIESSSNAEQNELTAAVENDDGMNGVERNELLNMRFAQDLRVADVRRMLKSSKQIKIHLKQQSGTSDHDFREEQEHYLYSICLRTMTLPIGRGMFTLRTFEQLLIEHVGAPKLCLTGKSSTQNLTIELTHIETPPNMDLWPQFHNGVAAALRIKAPRNAPLNSAWIISNMPKSPTGVLQPENAGFLFGLGLNGHLANLALFNIHEYLVKGDSMTSVAVLLGISAAKCKTNDVMAMKMLATHVPFLLPPTLLELNVDPQIQNAAVVGVGLLCAESGNHRLAEALLREIGRPPTAQTDNFVDRESYALSCGLALGLVTLGRGNLTFGDPDFTLADELILLMNGGHKRPHHFATSQTPSNIMKEGEFLNVHVTSTPATLALGMMYIKSNDVQAASWLNLPDTLMLLDSVRPDCLLVRVLSKSLILWDDVEPSIEWVERQLPAVLHKYSALIIDQDLPWYRDVDFETISQSYSYIVAGACFSIGMKFAGSANAEAFFVLIHYCKAFLADNAVGGGGGSIFGSLLQKAGKYTVETCLNVVVMSLGMVMAATGNLDVLRIVRRLRKRLTIGSNYLVPHMTLGLLFLGGGKYNLKTDNLSLAAMLCAFFPKFPLNSNDNRYHLQALRHLYVLSCQPRVLITKDEENGQIAYCSVRIFFKKTKSYRSTSVLLKAPCPLPELHLISELVVEDVRFWPVRFVWNRNWADLEKIVFDDGALMIRRRAGFDSYKDDPLGYKSAIYDNSFKPIGTWSLHNEPRLNDDLFDKFRSLRLFCTRHECLDALPFLIDLYESVSMSSLSTFGIWQLKLALAYMQNRKNFKDTTKIYRCVFSEEYILSLSTILEEKLITEINANELKLYIGKWVSNIESGSKNFLGEFLTFFDISARDIWSEYQVRDYRHLRSFVEKFQSSKMPLNSVITIQRILMR